MFLNRFCRGWSGAAPHSNVSPELRVAGMGESALEQRIKPIYTRYADVNTTILAAPGEIQIHLRLWTDDAALAKKNWMKFHRVSGWR